MESFKQSSGDYVTRVLNSPADVPPSDWDRLLSLSDHPSPFMQHAYLSGMDASGCARPETGWTAQWLTLWRHDRLAAACPLYLKDHSYGEYVFDWAWARAYADHGLDYFPKALVAVPFTPVPGSRLLAVDQGTRKALVHALIEHVRNLGLSSLHLLFGSEDDIRACEDAGMMVRQTVQFHWQDHPPGGERWNSFDEFLGSLTQEKRKKIRQERRKVSDAGVTLRCVEGPNLSDSDWDFFQRCYQRTYAEHGNPPYLNAAFFDHVRRTMPKNWLLFIAEREGRALASSLIALDPQHRVAFGRYWGALERVDCLHFECCYYAPIEWCIRHGYHRFEGGAQGEHKMSRALLPVATRSAHWLRHPAFADAVQHYLAREGAGMEAYLAHLAHRSPLKKPGQGAIDENSGA